MGNDVTELSLASLQLSELESCVELMFFTAYADGTVDASERAAFEQHVVRATRGQLRPELVQAVLEQIESRVKVADRAVRVRALADRTSDVRLRHAMLRLAATVAMADGTLTDDERAFLEEVGAAFALTADETRQVIAGVSAGG